MLHTTIKFTWSNATLMKINGRPGWDIGKQFYLSKKCEYREKMRSRTGQNYNDYLKFILFMN